MKKTPKVAVLISIINGEKSLNHTFESLVKQSMQDFSIVCIDDYSQDKTFELLKVWKSKFKDRLTVVRNAQHLGLTKSLNKGLKLIQSPYTARIDDDDWWHKDKLAKQVAFLDSHPDYDVIGSNYINVSNAGEKKVVKDEDDATIRRSIIFKSPFAHSCVMYRTKFILQLGGYDETVRYGQDYELWLRCLPKTKFYNIQEFLCYRTVGPQIISVTRQREQMSTAIQVRRKYIKKYQLPLISYWSLAEPLLILLIPNFVKTLKRKFFG